ncbi:hypothetical protein [Stackebrandtia soli]|uniref:hypothetical protein n=1 Tax=Stackebrandtia soli TaxID=1892856 RepID=UPI0039E98BF8
MTPALQVWKCVNALLLGAACVAMWFGLLDGQRYEQLSVGFGVPGALSTMGWLAVRPRWVLDGHIERSRRNGTLMPARVEVLTQLSATGRRRDYRLTLTAVPRDAATYQGTTTVRISRFRAVALRPGAVVWAIAAQHDPARLNLVPIRLKDSVAVDWTEVSSQAATRTPLGPVDGAVRRTWFVLLADPERWLFRIGCAALFGLGAWLAWLIAVAL